LEAARPTTVVEVGTGAGGLGTWLARRLTYVGVEPDDESRSITGARLATVGAGRVVASLDELPPEATFDLLCSFEVLEHIEDDVALLKQWRARIRVGGWLLLSFPAHSTRFGAHDELAGHLRRYDRATVADRLGRAGFEVERVYSYGAIGGQALEHLRNLRARRHGVRGSAEERTHESGHLFQPTSSGVVLANAAFALPLRLLQRPFRETEMGIGYVVLGRRSAP
jgi:SAM-dependent methyltransferase